MNDNADQLIDTVRRSWKQGIEPDLASLLPDESTCEQFGKTRQDLAVDLIIEDIRSRASLSTSRHKTVKEYVEELSTVVDLSSATYSLDLLMADWEIWHRAGRPVDLRQIHAEHPQLAAELEEKLTAGEYFRSLPAIERRRIIDRDAQDSEIDSAHDPHATTLPANVRSLGDRFETEEPSSIDTLPTRYVAEPVAAAPKTPGVPTHLGRYRVERKLGAGAFGDVYLGYDDKLRRHVAIKVPRREFWKRHHDRQGFLAEARVAASLNHPGIVTTHDIVEQDDGTVLLVMEYVPDGTLEQLLQKTKQGQPLKTKFIASVGQQVALALSEAHQKGLIHRDLKPANLLVSGDKVQVTDFGLAISLDDAAKGAGLGGTPQYMSPEQVKHEEMTIDARSDIWSLGVILYHLSTGKLPFSGNREDLFNQICNHTPTQPRAIDRSIPVALESVIMRCLEKRPEDRFQSISEVAYELRPLATIDQRGCCRWECVVLPIGVMLTIAGLLFAIEGFFALLTAPHYTTQSLSRHALSSYLTVALTAGIGPPLIALGNWFCCRRIKTFGGDMPNVPCRVSRWAVACLVSASATAGWGPPMWILTVFFATAAVLHIRKRKLWITGYRHVMVGVSLSTVLLLLWCSYWMFFTDLYRKTVVFDDVDQAISQNDLAAAESLLEAIRPEGLFEFDLTYSSTVRQVYEARLALEKGEYTKAIDIAAIYLDDQFTGSRSTHINVSIVLYAIRATALHRTGEKYQSQADVSMIESMMMPPVFIDIPIWAEKLIEDLPKPSDDDMNAFPPPPLDDSPEAFAPIIDTSA